MQERQIKPELEMKFDSVFRVRANHEISLFQSPMIFPELYWGKVEKKKGKKIANYDILSESSQLNSDVKRLFIFL